MVSTWKEKKKQQLKEQFYKVALALFRKQGFESTTIKQITDEVGTGKGTFFNYYTTKAEILVQWYQVLSMEALTTCQKKPFVSAYQSLLDLALELAHRVVAESDLWVMKTKNAFVHDELIEQEIVLDRAIEAFCREKLELGISCADLPANLDLDLIIGTFGALLTGTGHSWVAQNLQFDLVSTLEQRIAFLFKFK